jgi:hypothetical protein
MQQIIATEFLTAAILTLVLPVGILVAIGIYWVVTLRAGGDWTKSSTGPGEP